MWNMRMVANQIQSEKRELDDKRDEWSVEMKMKTGTVKMKDEHKDQLEI